MFVKYVSHSLPEPMMTPSDRIVNYKKVASYHTGESVKESVGCQAFGMMDEIIF